MIKVIYATLAVTFIFIMLQSYAIENPAVFNKFDSSLRRLDSMTVKTREQVICLYEHREHNEHTIDSLSNVIKTIKKVNTYKASVVHDTVFVAVDPD